MSAAGRADELATLLEGTGIALLSLTEGGETLTLRRAVAATVPRPIPAPTSRLVAAPCAGVFLHAHPLRDETLVEPGLRVQAGAILGLLRIGPLLVDVCAPCGGTLLSVDAADGALVGFGTALFRLSDGDAAA